RPPLYTSRPPPRLHSFPTRRSSDLSRRGLQLAQRLLIANHARIAGIEVFADSRRRAEGRAFFQGCRRYFHSGDEIAVDPFYFLADRKSTRLNSSHVKISYAVFCLKK